MTGTLPVKAISGEAPGVRFVRDVIPMMSRVLVRNVMIIPLVLNSGASREFRVPCIVSQAMRQGYNSLNLV